MFLDDVLAIYAAAGVGTYGTNMFKSSKAAIPAGAGPFLGLIETGGSGPVTTHNAAAAGLPPAYVRPNAQTLVRASSEAAARAMIDAAYYAIVRVGQRSQLVNGVWWVKAGPLQEPFDFGVDTSGRVCFVFNLWAEKRPNAAMSL